MSTLADEASKNAKHWVKKAIDEGYVTVRELRFYRKYGEPELISQCLVNDDGDEGMERHTSASENHDEFKAKGETKLTSTHLKVMKGAVAAAQAGGMRTQDGSEVSAVSETILQGVTVKGDTSKLRNRIGTKPIPRRFKPVGKEFMQTKQPDLKIGF